MASIEQRKGNWSTYWRLGGAGGKKQRCTFGTEKLALRAKEIAEAHRHRISKVEVEAILGITESPEKPRTSELPTVREWADTWLDSRTRIGPDQRRRIRSQLDRVILPAIGDLHLDEVSGVDVVEILKGIIAAGSTPATATRYFATIFSLFAFAVKEKKIDDNPASRTDFVRDLIAADDADDDGEDHVYLTRAEYQMIWSSMAPAGRPVLDLLIGTGARWSEATAVLVSGFHPGPKPAAHVKIHRAWKRDDQGGWYVGPTKGRNKRVVTISAHHVEALRPLILEADGKTKRPGDALLLTAAKGGRLIHSNFANRFWEPAIRAAMRCVDHPPEVPDGVSTCDCETRLKRRPTLHDLRHTHVAWLIAASKPIAAISRRVGHHTTEITEVVYGGITREVQQELADAIDDVFKDFVADITAAERFNADVRLRLWAEVDRISALLAAPLQDGEEPQDRAAAVVPRPFDEVPRSLGGGTVWATGTYEPADCTVRLKVFGYGQHPDLPGRKRLHYGLALLTIGRPMFTDSDEETGGGEPLS